MSPAFTILPEGYGSLLGVGVFLLLAFAFPAFLKWAFRFLREPDKQPRRSITYSEILSMYWHEEVLPNAEWFAERVPVGRAW